MGTRKTMGMIAAVAAALAMLAPISSGATDAASRLSDAITYKTISFQDPAMTDEAEFLAFHDYLEKTYPLVHKNLKREKVNGLGLLYTWEGTDPTADALVLMAHQDVVPIAPGTDNDWTYRPFSGRIADGYVWGRGAMDCKGFLIAVLEAVEGLLREGYQPRRTVYLAFGQDEEVGGDMGAAAISALLESRGVRADLVIDEGGFIVDGSVLMIDKPVALVGIAEKGYMSLELTVRAEGGHSSMPPPETAIGILGAAIHRLEKHPFPSRLGGVSVMTLDSLAPEMPAYLRTAIRGRKLIGWIIKSELSKINATNAILRTTTAATIIEAGTKENVLPQEARAVVNFRLLPGDGSDYVIARVKKVIDDDRVEVKPIGEPREASQVSRIDSEGYGLLSSVIAQSFPDAVLAPFLVLGGTDARHFENISDSVYRFSPMKVSEEDQARAHGTDERIGTENLDEIIDFYRLLIKSAD